MKNDDPLLALLSWPMDVREKVRGVLLPLCWIDKHSHDIQWRNTAEGEELSARWELVGGALYELGLRKQGQIPPARALQLVEILQKLSTRAVWRADGSIENGPGLWMLVDSGPGFA